MKDSITDLLPELCDHFPDLVQVAEPMFINFAGLHFVPGEFVYADNNGMLISAKQLILPDMH